MSCELTASIHFILNVAKLYQRTAHCHDNVPCRRASLTFRAFRALPLKAVGCSPLRKLRSLSTISPKVWRSNEQKNLLRNWPRRSGRSSWPHWMNANLRRTKLATKVDMIKLTRSLLIIHYNKVVAFLWGQLAAFRWRSKLGRPSKIPSLGEVDPTGTYCPVPDDWLSRKYGRVARFATYLNHVCLGRLDRRLLKERHAVLSEKEKSSIGW